MNSEQIDTSVAIDFPQSAAAILTTRTNRLDLWQAIVYMKKNMVDMEKQATKLAQTHKAVVRAMKVAIRLEPEWWMMALYSAFRSDENQAVKMRLPDQEAADKFLAQTPDDLGYVLEVSGCPAVMIYKGKVVDVTQPTVEIPLNLKDRLVLPESTQTTTEMGNATFQAKRFGQSVFLRQNPKPRLSEIMGHFVVAMDMAIREGKAFDAIQ